MLFLENFYLYVEHYYLLLPECFLFFSILSLILFGIYFSTKEFNKKFIFITPLFAILVFIILVYYYFILDNLLFNSFSLFNDVFISNNYILTLKKFFICLFFFFFSSYSEYVKKTIFDIHETIILLLITLFAFNLLISINNFLTMYLVIELYNLSIYTILGLKKNSKKVIESSVKYFIYGSFSSAILLFSISFLYGFTGITNFNNLIDFFWFSQNSEFPLFIYFSIILLTLAFLFKLGLAPFHIWIIEVYNGSPLIFTFFLTLFSKLVLVTFLIRLYLKTFFIFYFIWSPIIIVFISFSFIIGILGSIFNLKLKKIFIYSSIFSSGFFLFPFFLANAESLAALFLFIFIYSINLISLFFFLLNFWDLIKISFLNNLVTFSGFFSSNFWISCLFLVNLLSLAGIPPFAGFFGKFFLFFSLITSNYFYLFLFFNLINLVGLFYYLRLVKILLISKNSNSYLFLGNFSKITSLTLACIFLFNIFFFIFSKPFILFFHELTFFIF